MTSFILASSYMECVAIPLFGSSSSFFGSFSSYSLSHYPFLLAMEDNNSLFLPPGFRFHPTDEEIITCYLSEKVGDESFSPIAMGEVDLNKSEPWDLPGKAKYGEKEWYFFCQKEKRYPTGTRTNRATESGYWKATGQEKEIHNTNGMLVGLKKTLVFYRGRGSKGEKTNWVMHDFRLEGDNDPIHHNFAKGWVVVKVFQKKEGQRTNPLIKEQLITRNVEDEFCIQDQVNQADSTDFLGQCKVQGPLSDPMVGTLTGTQGWSNDWDNEIPWYDDGLPSEPLFYLDNMWSY